MQEDFATAVQAKVCDFSFILIGVYLQSLTSDTKASVETYKTELASITGIINQFCDSTDPVIIGDFQCCPKKQ